MSDAPERIWLAAYSADDEAPLWEIISAHAALPDEGDVEYIRADLHAAEVSRLTAEWQAAEAKRNEYQAGALLVAKGSHDLNAMIDECAPYLKDGETPRQRMDRDHADVLSLMQMLAKDRTERDELRAKVARLVEAGNWLSVCAQTTGGTAGRDGGLVDAVEQWSAALASVQTGEKP